MLPSRAATWWHVISVRTYAGRSGATTSSRSWKSNERSEWDNTVSEAAQSDRAHLRSPLEGAPIDDRALLSVRGLVKHFPITKGLLQRRVGAVQAVDGIDFDVYKGETLGLVGESGCGKTTTGRLLTRLLEPTAGTIVFEGQDISTCRRAGCARSAATCR